jgi:serine/threonine-protein kinase
VGGVLDLGAESGSYRLLRRIGKGGYAEVWLARRVGAAGFQRDVALKRIRPDHLADDEDGPVYRKMFLDEARVVAALHHPGVAQVYDLQVHADGTYYLVMEYVAGCTLREATLRASRKGRALSVGFCCYVAAQVGDAIDYAYNACDLDGRPLRIVHRDVNPRNIMLADSGATKLLDFGIAYSYLEHRDRTRTGFMKGKYCYMSPEQADGVRELDTRSDVFALGIVLTELLTGHRPFDGPSDCETKTIDKVRAAAPADLHAVSNGLPAPLQAILARALSRDASARFQNGAELATALRTYMLDAHVLFGPSEAAQELRALGDLPDAPVGESVDTAGPSTPPSASAAPVHPPVDAKGGGSTASSSASSTASVPTSSAQPSAPSESRLKKHLAARARLTNPQNPRRKLVKPALLIFGVALAVNGAIMLVTRVNDPKRTHVEVEKTPAQVRAEREAEERALLPTPAAPGLPAVRNPATTLAMAAALPAATNSAPALGSAPAPTPPLTTQRRTSRRLAAAGQATVRPAAYRRRSLDTSTATAFADAPSHAGASSTGTLPPGTLIPARLLVSADASNPGPVTATVTKDVEAKGNVVVPEGSTLVCAATGTAAGLPRVAVSCESITINGQSVRLSGIALGTDQGRGIPVASSGGAGGGEPARSGAISTGARVVSRLIGADGIAGDLIDGSVRAGEQTAQLATSPRATTLEPAPKGTRFFVFVASFGSSP